MRGGAFSSCATLFFSSKLNNLSGCVDERNLKTRGAFLTLTEIFSLFMALLRDRHVGSKEDTRPEFMSIIIVLPVNMGKGMDCVINHFFIYAFQ